MITKAPVRLRASNVEIWSELLLVGMDKRPALAAELHFLFREV